MHYIQLSLCTDSKPVTGSCQSRREEPPNDNSRYFIHCFIESQILSSCSCKLLPQNLFWKQCFNWPVVTNNGKVIPLTEVTHTICCSLGNITANCSYPQRQWESSKGYFMRWGKPYTVSCSSSIETNWHNSLPPWMTGLFRQNMSVGPSSCALDASLLTQLRWGYMGGGGGGALACAASGSRRTQYDTDWQCRSTQILGYMIHHDKFLHLHIQHLTLPSILENSGIVIK